MNKILSYIKTVSLKSFNLFIKYLPFIIVLALSVGFDHFIIFKLKANHKKDIDGISKALIDSIAVLNEMASSTDQDLKELDEKLNARVDTIDNIINADDRRRELIIRIRKAIEENTTRNLGARNLNNIANAVIDSSYQYNLTIPQVLAQIEVESDFNITAVSSARAKGLMQILPETLVYIQAKMPDAPTKLNPFNVYNNIKAGCFYMDEQIKEFGDYEQALMAYNWGPHRVRSYNAGEDITIPTQTQKYIPLVLENIEKFKKYGLE